MSPQERQHDEQLQHLLTQLAAGPGATKDATFASAHAAQHASRHRSSNSSSGGSGDPGRGASAAAAEEAARAARASALLAASRALQECAAGGGNARSGDGAVRCSYGGSSGSSSVDLGDLERGILLEAEELVRRQNRVEAAAVAAAEAMEAARAEEEARGTGRSGRGQARGAGGGLSDSTELELLLAEAEDGIAAAVGALGASRSGALASGTQEQRQQQRGVRGEEAGAGRKHMALGSLITSGGTLDPVFEEPVAVTAAKPPGAAVRAVKGGQRGELRPLQRLGGPVPGTSARMGAADGGSLGSAPHGFTAAASAGGGGVAGGAGCKAFSSPGQRRRPSPARVLEQAGLSPLRGAAGRVRPGMVGASGGGLGDEVRGEYGDY